MLTVPAGGFWMGCNAEVDTMCVMDPAYHAGEYPYHDVYLDTFKIDETEVTMGQYSACVESGLCEEPQFLSEWCNYGEVGKEEHPVDCVNWHQAKSFCEAAGKRLCTEAEWEKAARGGCSVYPGEDCQSAMPVYPWGDDPGGCDTAVANVGGGIGCGTGSTMLVGSKPQGASPYGALDMSGNVTEWVADWYDDEYYEVSPGSNPQGPPSGTFRSGRGGNFGDYYGGYLRASARWAGLPDFGSQYVGFRCCD